MPYRFPLDLFVMRRLLAVLLILLSASAGNAAERKGEAYFDFGMFAFEEGDFEGAEENFRKAVRLNPANADYHHYLGKTYLKTKRYKKAENALYRAWKRQPGLEGLTFDRALVQYHLGIYPVAVHLFAEEVAANPSNATAQYYLGICMYKRKQYHHAREHFMQAAHKSPSIKPNGYYYAGICDMQLARTEKAAENFAWVAENAPPGELKASAAKWLASIRAWERADNPLRLNLKFSPLYDDNVALEPVDQDVYADEGDFGMTLFLSAKYRLMEQDHLSAGIGYSHYQSLYVDLNEYNLMGVIPNAYLKWGQAPWTLGLTLQPIYYWLDNEKYLLRKQAGLDLFWNITEQFSNRYALVVYDESNYITTGKSGQNVQLLVDGYYRLPDKNLSLLGGLGYEQNLADHDDYRYAGLLAKFSAAMELPQKITVSPSVRIYGKRHSHTDSGYGKKRDDTKLSLAVSVSRSIVYAWLTGAIEYSYTRNDSNIDIYSYQSNKIGFALTASY